MEISDQYKSSHPAVSSSDNAHIASLSGSRLSIRSTTSFEVIRSINVPSIPKTKSTWIRWSPIDSLSRTSSRILVANEDNVRVWDVRDDKWTSVINNGSGGMGKSVNVDFGRTENEVLIFYDFNSKVTIWSLSTGRSVDIKDPKFSSKGFAYRAHTGLFSLLSRPGPQDIVTLHAPNTYFVLKTITAASSDAQGLKWSPDGRWLVIWDTPSTGLRLFIYTADGNLYRIYNGQQDGDIEGLGVKSVEWSPNGEHLAIGGYDKRVTLLSTRTFSPVVFLDHTPIIQLASGTVWQEQITASFARSYGEVEQPVTPPSAVTGPNENVMKSGISIASFNADGSLIATRDDASPTGIWIWDITNLTPRTVLLHHSTVKQITWHPTRPDLLLIHCAHDIPIIYTWDASRDAPEVIAPTFTKGGGKVDYSWFNTPKDRRPSILFGDSQGHVVCWPDGRDPILRFEHPGTPDPDHKDESEDSLYEILTGRKSLPEVQNTEMLSYEAEFDDSQPLEDTFRSRKKAEPALGASMDESFF